MRSPSETPFIKGQRIAFAAGYPRPLLLGMVHLHPLPGSPRYSGDLENVIQAAAKDLKALVEGGVDGIIVENLGDAPYYPDQAPPVTIAAMTAVTSRLVERVPRRFLVGINVLRNAAEASLSIAVAVGASFIRVNVHTDAVVADQGILVGKAHETLRLRRNLDARVAILADVAVKHAVALQARPIEEQASDAAERGLADGILITGPRSGAPVDSHRLEVVRRSIPRVPLLVASGVTAASVTALARYCDGFIVGTHIKRGGVIDAPVDIARVRRLVKALAGLRR